MEQAIKKAIEGGYRKDIVEDHADLCSCGGSTTCAGKDHYKNGNFYKICLDPLFWQALGKAEGWKNTGVFRACLCAEKKFHTHEIEEWEVRWHSFIDHLIAGKDIDSFFNELLK